jgi:hypothetical protein
MTHEEYLLERTAAEWWLEQLEIAMDDTEPDTPRMALYKSTAAALRKELEELDARFLAH